eukprot:3505198-Alexandrium_andersonii.AAC.1
MPLPTEASASVALGTHEVGHSGALQISRRLHGALSSSSELCETLRNVPEPSGVVRACPDFPGAVLGLNGACLLYTSDAADDM